MKRRYKPARARRRKLGNGADCYGKKRYRDEAAASDALSRNRKSGRDRVAKRYYYCVRCEGFHLTSQDRTS